MMRVADSYAQNRFRGTTEGKESSKEAITVIQARNNEGLRKESRNGEIIKINELWRYLGSTMNKTWEKSFGCGSLVRDGHHLL